MAQINLFEVEKKKIAPNMRCRNCQNCYSHQYNSSIKYCSISKQKGTSYGHKKIKALDPACPQFKAIQTKQPNKMKFRKKPVVIDAFQFNPDSQPHYNWNGEYSPVRSTSYNEIVNLLKTSGNSNGISWDRLGVVETLEGRMVAEPGDWIIKGVNGEFYPCKPDIFEKTYEPVVYVEFDPLQHENMK